MMFFKKSLVSVSMVSYNHSKYIKNAIESILLQDYSDIEIVVSDDASTDNTVEIVEELIKKYPGKIRLLKNKSNIGPVNNWFKCVTNCNGKYVIGLSGDDEFLPGAISKQVEVLESDPKIAMTYGDVIVYDFNKKMPLYKLSDKSPTKSGGINVALSESIYYSPSHMFRRNLVPKVNIFSSIRYGSDLAFYKELMIVAGEESKICYIPDVLYKYQKHGANITLTQQDYRKDHIEAIALLQKKYSKYKALLSASIYEFCCVAFFKNILIKDFSSAYYFLSIGIRESGYNPLLFFRPVFWAIKFKIKLFLRYFI